MKRIMVGVVAAASLALGGLSAVVAPTPASAQEQLPPVDGVWESVFNDEFNAPHTPEGKDLTVVRNGVKTTLWRNDGTRPMSGCVDVTGGTTITLWPRPYVKPDWECKLVANAEFSGGTYLFAARIRVHRTTGHLSSFWLNGDGAPLSQANEIDVIENEGVQPPNQECKAAEGAQITRNISDFHGLNHAYYSQYDPHRIGHKHCFRAAKAETLHDDQFHVFQAMLTPGVGLKFFIDGQPSTEFTGSHYARLSPLKAMLTNRGAVGKDRPFEVDWVRVYKLAATPTTPPPPPPPPAPCDNDCYRAQMGPYLHYVYRENSNPSSPLQARIVLDKKFYVDSYPDVRAWAEGKVAEQGGNLYDHAQWHWLNRGIPEGRMGSATLDPYFYLQHNPDIAAAYGATNYEGAIRHYVQFGRFEGRRASVLFDPGHYKARYGDMAGASSQAVVDHFTNFGMDEGRQGSADFAPAWYLGTNADLRTSFGKNYRKGMSHWIANGRNEGRKGAP